MRRNQQAVLAVEYIGRHENGREDKAFKTGTVWEKPGDIQFVARAAAIKMTNRHPDNFRLVTDDDLGEFLAQKPQSAASGVLSDTEKAQRQAEKTEREAQEAEAKRVNDATELGQALDDIVTREDLEAFTLLNDETSGMPLHKNKKLATLKEEVKARLSQAGKLL